MADGFKLNQSDLRAFNGELKRLVKVTNRSSKSALKQGTYHLCRSLSASTKLSKKTKSVTLPKKKAYRVTLNNGETLYYVWYYDKQGNKKYIPVWGTSKQDVKSKKIAKIKRRGLAKQMWSNALRALYGRSIGKGYNVKQPSGILKTKKTEKPGDYGISIDNNLDYADKAFKNKGKQDINTAVQRATNSIKTIIERDLSKEIK